MLKKLTTYLTVVSALLIGAMFFLHFATIIGPDNEHEKIMYYEKIPYTVMLIMLLAAGICAIFCNRFPLLQARVCMIAALMFIGFQIWLGVDFFRFHNEMVFSPTMIFPLAAAILDMMAARKALVDGMMMQAVKSMKKKKR